MLINSDFNITILHIVAANRLNSAATDGFLHRRNRLQWAVVLKREGKTYYTAKGREILSDSLHPVILPKGSSYNWRCAEPGECLMIEFDAPQESSDLFSFSLTDNSFFVHSFSYIQQNLYSASPEARLETVHRLYGLLVQLIKTLTKDHAPRGKQQILQPAISYISEKYYLPDISNDQLAQLCGVSTVYFRKCFETVYGDSPIRYLHHFRIQMAKNILSSDYGSITQVAESVGYSSVYHFSKMFKIYTGLSPTQYVKASRQ